MKKALIMFAAVILTLISVFLIIDHYRFSRAEYVDGKVAKWRRYLPDDPEYDMAVNAETGETMFKDPMAAMKKFKEDFKDDIEFVAEEYGLPNFSKYTYWKYMIPDDERPEIFYRFGSVFENSFEKD